ncbi:MAG: sulfotransferase [Actinomycetota bacterium]
MPERSPFPFVVGSGRSGTTLLRLMLEQHPDLAIPPESYFPISMRHREPRYVSSAGFDLDAFVTDLLRNVRFQDWGLNEQKVRTALHGAEAIDWAEAIRRTFALYAEREGKPRYGDKTPWFIMRITELSELFPESRFVHLIRDGRDVALSIREMSWGPSRMPALAEFWAKRIRIGRTEGARLGPERYLELRYEDLVEDPVSALRRVCPFLDLDFRQEMLDYSRRAPNAVLEREREQHRHLSKPVTKQLRDWKTQMSPDDLAVFEAVAGRELVACGYDRAVPSPSLSVRVRAGTGVELDRQIRLAQGRARKVVRKVRDAAETKRPS